MNQKNATLEQRETQSGGFPQTSPERSGRNGRLRRSRGLLVAVIVALVSAGCASLPAPNSSGDQSCVGPVSFCNLYFGS